MKKTEKGSLFFVTQFVNEFNKPKAAQQEYLNSKMTKKEIINLCDSESEDNASPPKKVSFPKKHEKKKQTKDNGNASKEKESKYKELGLDSDDSDDEWVHLSSRFKDDTNVNIGEEKKEGDPSPMQTRNEENSIRKEATSKRLTNEKKGTSSKGNDSEKNKDQDEDCIFIADSSDDEADKQGMKPVIKKKSIRLSDVLQSDGESDTDSVDNPVLANAKRAKRKLMGEPTPKKTDKVQRTEYYDSSSPMTCSLQSPVYMNPKNKKKGTGMLKNDADYASSSEKVTNVNTRKEDKYETLDSDSDDELLNYQALNVTSSKNNTVTAATSINTSPGPYALAQGKTTSTSSRRKTAATSIDTSPGPYSLAQGKTSSTSTTSASIQNPYITAQNPGPYTLAQRQEPEASSTASRATNAPTHNIDSVNISTSTTTIEFDGIDLMSPIASAGRPSIETVATNASNTNRKIKVPTPAIPVEVANEIGGKLYPDLRNHFISTLLRFAKITRTVLHQRSQMEHAIRAIIDLAFYPFPIRTVEGVQAIKSGSMGKNGPLLNVLKEDVPKKKKDKVYNPPRGKYVCAASCAIAVMFDFEAGKQGDDRCITMEELIENINHKTHLSNGGKMNKGVDYYLDKKNMDPSWLQVRKLASMGYIKERSRKKACASGIVFELQEKGRNIARIVKGKMRQGICPVGPMRQLASFTVPEEYGNVTVVIDHREGGGNGKGLHTMCDFMDHAEVPYVVRDLKISDYVFFVGDKLAPVLIERKSIEDLAGSLFDGRWESQQRKMRKAQYVLGGPDRKCHMCYLIEGDVDKAIVHGGYVGRAAHRIKPEDIRNAIAKLPTLGFSVIESKTKYGSLDKIKQVAKDFLWRANNGSITCQYTYDEFVQAVNRLSDDKGDPPTDERFQNPAPPIVPEAPIPTANTTSESNEPQEESEETKKKREELLKLPMKDLKAQAKERAEKQSGSKKELVERLLQPRKPEILISRSRRGQYIPKVPSCNAAILVALHLHHEPGTPELSKEQIMNYAEETGVSKDPMFGKGKSGYGGYNYDGWSGIKDMTGGDPALISVVKRKYALTTKPHGEAGVEVAKAVHIVAHRQGICRCGRYVDTS
ncbi:hypothetical protein CTEN210_00764 [Chaetoceros tenuissimus]|uniref:Crossover junction endonuclease MUS81 n=1 Tax=Chaetoceros tenuissimus TaxID=426638 RepID=A0AAD3CFT0_9STRA|nr:hypothetical protein CTEN210_00764 [Chaetoceros tenuissimus]